jgi:hypothetical protein
VVGSRFVGYDPDAFAYFTAVEAADGQALEDSVRDAYNAFVVGCKVDGIWTAIKASCILAGARTLAGALVPLVGTAPTNNNFVSGDYNRETGLIGNNSSKYLDSNRANNADPQDSQHLAVYSSSRQVVTDDALGGYIGDLTAGQDGASYIYDFKNAAGSAMVFRSRGGAEFTTSFSTGLAFIGLSRGASGSFTSRVFGTNTSRTQASSTPTTGNLHVFRLNRSSGDFLYTDARIAFYSIGESLDLALLDTRVTALINAIAAAIP